MTTTNNQHRRHEKDWLDFAGIFCVWQRLHDKTSNKETNPVSAPERVKTKTGFGRIEHASTLANLDRTQIGAPVNILEVCAHLNMSGSFFCVKIYVALPFGCSEIWYQQNQTRFLVTVLPTTILQLRGAIILRHVHTNINATTFTHHLAPLAGASLRRTSSWHSWINHVESKIQSKSSVLKSCLNRMYI